MAVKRGQTLDVEITQLAFGGRGLTKIDGFAVFVDRVVPGDRARVRVFRKKKRHAEARLLEILSPSSMRIDPPCPYFGLCGGCSWQFMPYDQQIRFKREHVVESLSHIGKIPDTMVLPTIPSARVFGYRNKMEFSFSDKRWLLPEELGKPDVSKDLGLGLHVPGTFFKVLDIEACLLQPDLGNAILNDVRDYVKKSGVPPYGLRSHMGFWRFLMLRHSVKYDLWMVNIVTADGPHDRVRPLAEFLARRYPSVRSVVHNINTKRASIAFGEKEKPLIGDPFICDGIGRLEFDISANSFFQTNTEGAKCLYDTVKKYAQLTGGEIVMDLYSGTGTIAIYLAHNASQVIGMEISESAVEDAKRNCRKNGIDNCTFIEGDILDNLSDVSEKPDVMVIDPPRAGVHPKVVEMVAALGPERIVYVSCNPTTMSRDIGQIVPYYRVVEVQPVDMFPHTYHIESVALLERLRASN